MTPYDVLPPHLAAVTAAVEDELPAPPATARLDAAVGRLAAGLHDLGTRLPPGSEVVVDGFTATRALSCPASRTIDGEAAPFAWTPHTSARWLGMKALELFLTGGAADVAAAVAAVCGGAVAGDVRGPAVWLRDLATPAERAATLAVATQWAEQAAQWAPWRRWSTREHRLRLEPSRGRWPRRRPPVAVRARWEADLRPDPSSRRRVALLLLDAAPDSAAATVAMRLTALGGWLDEPRADRGPARVVAVHPASGTVDAVEVDDPLLDAAVDDVLAAATVLVGAAAGQELPTTPGAGCRWCPRLDRCAEGTAWIERPDRRVAGLPVE